MLQGGPLSSKHLDGGGSKHFIIGSGGNYFGGPFLCDSPSLLHKAKKFGGDIHTVHTHTTLLQDYKNIYIILLLLGDPKSCVSRNANKY